MSGKKKFLTWICIGSIVLCSTLLIRTQDAYCMFGEDIPFLIQIITQAIAQVQELRSIIGSAQETVSVLEDMNRGVKEVLRLADTAHIPLPQQVYMDAKTVEDATRMSHDVYGDTPVGPRYQQMQYNSGTEALYLSEDAFEYSSFLDKTGESVKRSAVAANQASATRLTAETLGVLLHAVSHSNRLEAKGLEISATQRLQESQRENARYESFLDTQQSIENDFRNSDAPDLNALGAGGAR